MKKTRVIVKCDYCKSNIERQPCQLKYLTHFCNPVHAGLYQTKNLENLFWSHVRKGTPTECWIWMASLGIGGYGQSQGARAHRLAYKYTFGEIPEGFLVLHKCDNRPCVNPNHLELGTQRKNINDCSKRNRISRGENRPQHKLTEKQVLEIRERYASHKGSHSSLGKEFGVSEKAIFNIIHRYRWKHI